MNTVFASSSGVVGSIIVILLLGSVAVFASSGKGPSAKVLAEALSEPLNDAKTAIVDIDVSDGNLTIDRLASGEPLLASGTLQYTEKQGLPTRTLVTSNGHAHFTVNGGEAGQRWFRFPWAACNGATQWQIHLNPRVQFDITAHSNGGNVKLNLADMKLTRVLADTAGGNMDVVLPDAAADLTVNAKTGAGNVTIEIGSGITGSSSMNASSGAGNVEVRIPAGISTRIHAGSGLGKVIVDPRFSQIDDNTYQSPDYEDAADKIEITLNSGVGNVLVTAK